MKFLPSTPVGVWEFEVESVSNPNELALVVCRPDYPGLFFLNHAARFIWVYLKQGGPFSLLSQEFAAYFGISLAALRRT